MKILVEIPDSYWTPRVVRPGVKLDIPYVIDETVWPQYCETNLIGEVLEVVTSEDPR